MDRNRHTGRRGLRPSLMPALLAASCAAASTSAHAAELQKYATGHYILHTDLPRDEAVPYGRHMELVFRQYEQRFRGFRTAPPGAAAAMDLYLFAKRESFLRFLAGHGINATNSGGIFAVTSTLSGLFTWIRDRSQAETFSVLQHEGFHQFAYNYIGPDLPVWVNEGIAQYFEDGVLLGGRMHLGMVSAYRLPELHRALDEPARMVSFDELFSMSDRVWMQTMAVDPKAASLLYGTTWSIVHFLVHGNSGRYRSALERYLASVSRGVPSGEAFRDAFGSDIEPFRRNWERYVRSLEPDPLSQAVMRLQFLASGLKWAHARRDQVPLPASLADLRELLQRSQFRMVYTTPSVALHFDARDDSIYTYRTANGASRPFELTTPPEGLPPGIRASALRPQPSVSWTRNPDGEPAFAIEFR